MCAAASRVPVQMWPGRAQSRCRRGWGEPTPFADVAAVSPVPVQMWEGSGEPHPRAACPEARVRAVGRGVGGAHGGDQLGRAHNELLDWDIDHADLAYSDAVRMHTMHRYNTPMHRYNAVELLDWDSKGPVQASLQSRRRCGRGGSSPGADVAGVGPVPAQMWHGWLPGGCHRAARRSQTPSRSPPRRARRRRRMARKRLRTLRHLDAMLAVAAQCNAQRVSRIITERTLCASENGPRGFSVHSGGGHSCGGGTVEIRQRCAQAVA